MPYNWREIPADVVEEVITFFNKGQYPPTYEQLVAIAQRYRFTVSEQDNSVFPFARTYHRQRLIIIPKNNPTRMHRELLHEVAEMLLRLPVAPEFHFGCSPQDEYHEVARIVDSRL